MSILLRDTKRGDVVWESGYYYEAVSSPERCIQPQRHKDGHECQMLGLTGPRRGEVMVFFECITPGGYGLKMERADDSTAAMLKAREA